MVGSCVCGMYVDMGEMKGVEKSDNNPISRHFQYRHNKNHRHHHYHHHPVSSSLNSRSRVYTLWIWFSFCHILMVSSLIYLEHTHTHSGDKSFPFHFSRAHRNSAINDVIEPYNVELHEKCTHHYIDTQHSLVPGESGWLNCACVSSFFLPSIHGSDVIALEFS